MTTVMINDRTPAGMRLLEHIGKYPHVAKIVDNDNGAFLPYPEDELISHEQFKEHFEKRLFERLGLKIEL